MSLLASENSTLSLSIFYRKPAVVVFFVDSADATSYMRNHRCSAAECTLS